jgi:hypothetical protein
MTLKTCLFIMKIGTLLMVMAWALVVFNIDPDEAGIIGQVFFYASLFLMMAGILSLFFVWLRRKIIGDEMATKHLGVNFRQGILLSILVIVFLLFQSTRILTWWDGLLAAGGIFLVELYFLSRG